MLFKIITINNNKYLANGLFCNCWNKFAEIGLFQQRKLIPTVVK